MYKSSRRESASTSEQGKMEEELFKFVQNLWENNMRVTRTPVLRKTLEIYPLILGGKKSDDLMKKITKWFYYGFI